jgi:hypothetical protein
VPRGGRHRADEGRDSGEGIDPGQGDEISGGQARESRGDGHERDLRRDERGAPVVAVGDDPGGQTEQEEGNEPRQPEQPELERIARHVEHLPGHRHALDVGAGLGDDLCGPDEAKIAVAEHLIGAPMP